MWKYNPKTKLPAKKQVTCRGTIIKNYNGSANKKKRNIKVLRDKNER